MGNLKEVRNRIASVKNTQQITNAMKMVSASKLRKSQTSIQKIRPYNRKLLDILNYISRDFNLKEMDVPLLKKPEPEKVLLVGFSANRGLCGSFNSSIMKAFQKIVKSNYSQQKSNGTLHTYPVGKKIHQYLASHNYPIESYEEDLVEKPTYEKVALLADKLIHLFTQEGFDRIELVYNSYKNTATQEIISEIFLPMHMEEDENQMDEEEDSWSNIQEYIYEPSREAIIRDLLPKILRVQLFKIFLDSNAAEHGARMTAMHQATENAKELLKDLKLAYNKARQSAITNEIIEITSGANALRGMAR